MNTNSVPYLEQVLKINDTLLGLPALPLVALGCLAFGYFLKAIPVYKNRWIPAGVFACGTLLNLAITPIDNIQAATRALILGLVAGGISIVVHRKVMSRFINDDEFTNGDTKQLAKPQEENKP